MLRRCGGTISAKTGLLHAGAAHVFKTPIVTRAQPYRATVPGCPFSGSPCSTERQTQHTCTDLCPLLQGRHCTCKKEANAYHTSPYEMSWTTEDMRLGTGEMHEPKRPGTAQRIPNKGVGSSIHCMIWVGVRSKQEQWPTLR